MRAPRPRVLRSLLRATLTSTVLVVLYYRLPLTGALEASTVALLLAGLALFAGVITWQVRAILRSDYPGLRAIEALAAAIPLFLLVFAATYLKLAAAQPSAFSEPLSRTDALYFTITVFSTVGFGDITPVATPAHRHGPDAGRPGRGRAGPAGHAGRGQGGPAAAGRRLGRTRRIIPSGGCRAVIGHLPCQSRRTRTLTGEVGDDGDHSPTNR